MKSSKDPLQCVTRTIFFVPEQTAPRYLGSFSISGRSVEFEADNEESCRSWLETFCNRYSEAERAKYQLMTDKKMRRTSSLPVSHLVLDVYESLCCLGPRVIAGRNRPANAVQKA